MTPSKSPKPSQVKERLILVDGNAVLHRAWHALPPLTNREGQVVSGAYGFMMTLMSAIKKFQPTHLAVSFDLAGPTFRHEQYEEYKATREKKPDELYEQIPIIEEILEAMEVPVITAEGYEADDAIGTAAAQASQANRKLETVIVTGDLDTLQLVTDRVKVFTMRKGLTDTVLYDPAQVENRYGLRPDQMVDYKALRGDPSDNIPGVKGVGEKTATALISEYGSIDALYKALHKNDPRTESIKPGMKQKLIDGEENAREALDLCRIRTDAPIDFRLKDTEFELVDRARVQPLFEDLQFNRLLANWPGQEDSAGTGQTAEKETPDKKPADQEPTDEKSSAEGRAKKEAAPSGSSTGRNAGQAAGPDAGRNAGQAAGPDAGRNAGQAANQDSGQAAKMTEVKSKDLDALMKQLAKAKQMAFRCLVLDDHPAFPNVNGLGLHANGQSYYLPKKLAVANSQRLTELLNAAKPAKVCHDLKREITALKALGAEINAASADDLMLASYLMHAGQRRSQLDSVLAFYANLPPEPKDPDADERRARLSQELPHLIPVTERLKKEVQEADMLNLYREIELPLAPVLSRMERKGVLLDRTRLKRLSAELEKRLDKLTAEIHRLAGGEFNINSPGQIQEVLFERLAISTKGLKKTAKGKTPSTAASELAKIRDRHPIVDAILEYRELAKLKSTYVDSLPELAHPLTNRVHASFNQAITATGRLSSSDPNLQNIPTAGSDWGRRVRSAFTAGPGRVILAADYSQIELRLAAHLSGDESMIEAFQKGEDIHKRTAIEMFGEETPNYRRVAKAINFGILYGMGANRLAESAQISPAEAREYIERYFALRPKLVDYVETMKEKVREDGYVETLFGRRRFFENYDLMNRREQAEAERQGVNMPTQGTQADMIKLAMIRIDEALRQKSDLEAELIIQVHDELVLETKQGQAKAVAELIGPLMVEVIELAVPIEVNFKQGVNWGEMEPL